MYRLSHKCVSPIVATALLLVVVVVAVVGFQGWFSTYSSFIFTKTEQDSEVGTFGNIETLVGSNLYLKSNNENMTIREIKIENRTCNLVKMNYNKSIHVIDLSNCIDNLTTNTPEVVIVTDEGIISKKIFLRDVEVIEAIQSISAELDGKVWIEANTNTNHDLHSIESNGVDKLVAVGGNTNNDQIVISSTDGHDWTVRTTPDTQWLFKVIYANNRFTAVGDYRIIFSSTDGITWVERAAQYGGWMTDVAYNGSMYIVVGGSCPPGVHNVMSSVDGNTWVNRHDEAPECAKLSSIVYGNSIWVSLKSTGEFLTSVDGMSWTNRGKVLDTTFFARESLIFTDGNFLAIGNNGTNSSIYKSSNGIDWNKIKTFPSGNIINYINNKYFIPTSNNNLIYSDDLVVWHNDSKVFPDEVLDMTFLNQKLYVVGKGGFVYYTTLD